MQPNYVNFAKLGREQSAKKTGKGPEKRENRGKTESKNKTFFQETDILLRNEVTNCTYEAQRWWERIEKENRNGVAGEWKRDMTVKGKNTRARKYICPQQRKTDIERIDKKNK